MDSLISTYGAILQALLTMPAIVTFFISFSIQRKIERCIDTLENLQEKSWNDITSKEARDFFDSMLELYGRRFESAKLTRKAKFSIMTLYGLCALTSIIILVVIGISVVGEGIPFENLTPYFLVTSLSIGVILALGILLYDVVSPERAWIFKLDQPSSVCSAAYLTAELVIPSRAVIEKLGLIRISGVKEADNYYVEFCNHLLEKSMKYKVILKSRKGEIKVEEGTLPKGFYTNFEVKKDDFPPMFQTKERWQIWFEIEGIFPSSLSGGTPPFKALRYVLEEIAQESPTGIHVLFDLKAIAYRIPKIKYETFAIPEHWSWASDEWPHLTAKVPSCCID
jgi:hypothetical protein